MKILLADDDKMCREVVADFLTEQLGHSVTECSTGDEAWNYLGQKTYEAVISDLRMPGMDGIELLRRIRKHPPHNSLNYIILTGYGELNSALAALRAGATDYLLKPVNIEELANVISSLEEKTRLGIPAEGMIHRNSAGINRGSDSGTESTYSPYYREIPGIGAVGLFSGHMRTIMALAERLHNDRSVPVLIEGETGTGKEIIARIVHHGPSDCPRPFISINCPAISASLFESELFGYEGGAFTGAQKSGMMGKFELAQGGTLYLDEIGDMPLELQPKLLRVLEEKKIYRVGGIEKMPLDVRIVCSTNTNLMDLVHAGKFRSDLYYRLNTGNIYLKPLRETPEAIVPLAQLFLDKFAMQKKLGFKIIQKKAAELLGKYSWPGNVRELKNVIERIIILNDDVELRPEHLQFLFSGSSGDVLTEEISLKPGYMKLPPEKLDINDLESEIVRKTLEKFRGNKTKTASYLCISRSALRSRLKRLHTSKSF